MNHGVIVVFCPKRYMAPVLRRRVFFRSSLKKDKTFLPNERKQHKGKVRQTTIGHVTGDERRLQQQQVEQTAQAFWHCILSGEDRPDISRKTTSTQH
jgi:hypothetical protein